MGHRFLPSIIALAVMLPSREAPCRDIANPDPIFAQFISLADSLEFVGGGCPKGQARACPPSARAHKKVLEHWLGELRRWGKRGRVTCSSLKPFPHTPRRRQILGFRCAIDGVPPDGGDPWEETLSLVCRKGDCVLEQTVMTDDEVKKRTYRFRYDQRGSRRVFEKKVFYSYAKQGN